MKGLVCNLKYDWTFASVHKNRMLRKLEYIVEPGLAFYYRSVPQFFFLKKIFFKSLDIEKEIC